MVVCNFLELPPPPHVFEIQNYFLESILQKLDIVSNCGFSTSEVLIRC